MCDLLRKNYALDSSKMTGRSQETKQANNPNPEKEIHHFTKKEIEATKKFVNLVSPIASAFISPVMDNVAGMSAAFTAKNQDKKGLKIEITDKNGFGDTAGKENDLKLKANGKLKISKDSLLNAINLAQGSVLSGTVDATIGKIYFDKDDKSYNIPISTVVDDFHLDIKTEQNKVVIRVVNAQIADVFEDLLGKVESKIKSANLPFKVVKHDLKMDGWKIIDLPRIELIPDFKNKAISSTMEIKSSNINEKNTKVNIDNDGNLNIELENVEMEGRETIRDAKKNIIPEKSSGDADHASIIIGEEIKIKPQKAHKAMGDVEINIVGGKADINLDAKESDFNINELNLGKQFSKSTIKADNLHGKITLKHDNNLEIIPAKVPPEKFFEQDIEDVVFDIAKVALPLSGLGGVGVGSTKMLEVMKKTQPTIYKDKTSKVQVENFGGDLSMELEGPGRKVKLDGKVNTNLETKKTDFGNPAHKDTSSNKFQLKFVGNIDTDFKYNDGSTEGNKSKIEIEAGKDEKGNVTFKQNIPETNAGIENTFNKMSKGTHQLIIGGPQSFNKLKEKAEKAKESINIESFLLNGKPADELSEILARKASQGVKVRLILDSQFGDRKDTKGAVITPGNEGEFNKGALALTKAKEALIKKITDDKTLSIPKKKQQIENLNNNLDWRILEHGMMRIDHRKIWVFDGKEAITGGGVNLTQSAMGGTKNANGNTSKPKHDSMYEVHGPVIKQIQEGFVGFWNQNSEKPLSKKEIKELVKNESFLESEMLKNKRGNKDLSISKTQVLYTDEKHKQIYAKMIEQIKNAKTNINVEHAYIDHPDLLKALKEAVGNGVTVNILLPEESDEQDFVKFNNYDAIQQLKNKATEAGSKGKVNAYLYKNDVAFNHSKLMTFDGKSAIVGSANTTNRSLDNPVHYNKEMALFIEDDNFVKNVDQDLFQKDITDSSIDLNVPTNWEKYIKKNQAKIDKYKNIDGVS